ncbi:MAG: hypothetical protein WD872_13255, partial [Pirellulaceae bacterium]
MTTSSSSTSTTLRPRRLPRLRFGLSTLMAVMTLCAVGAWYWWRVPFRVEQTDARGNRTVETVRRLWGGKTIRSGLWERSHPTFGKLASRTYREGVLHGPACDWDIFGQIVAQGEYRGGKKHGRWTEYHGVPSAADSDPTASPLAQQISHWRAGLPHG